MIKAIYRDRVIATYVSRMEALIEHSTDPEVSLEKFCDICETNKITNHKSICDECHLGINVNIFI